MKTISLKRGVVFWGPVLVAVALSSCSVHFAKVPPADQVKTVAIVSVQASRSVTSGNKTSGGLTAMVSLAQTAQSSNDTGDFSPVRVADEASSRLAKMLGSIHGWAVAPDAQVKNSAAYQAFRSKQLGEQTGPMQLAYFTATDSAPVTWGMDEDGLAALAKELKVDAVVVMTLDLKFMTRNSVMGTGTATANVDVRISATHTSGKSALYVAGLQHRSDETMAMLAGNVIPLRRYEPLFLDSTQKTLDFVLENINKDL